MRKNSLLSKCLALVTCLTVGACTTTRSNHAISSSTNPQPPAVTASAAPPGGCFVKVPAPRSNMLGVLDVWPKTISVVYGYDAIEVEGKKCAQEGDPARISPSCNRSFPWILGDAERVNTLLGQSGIRRIATGTIRGHDPVPKGTVIDPQEIRERLLFVDSDADDNIVVRFAKACAKPFSANGISGYRTKVRSLDTGSDIDAFLLVGDHRIIWLEFDETGWKESNYGPILKKAMRKAVGA
jgi:hypothetical protein